MSKIKTIKLNSYKKKSGKLIPISFDKKFPINVKRIFYIFGKKNEYRGDHAHKKCKQLFIPISGNISLILKSKDQNSKINLSPKKYWCFSLQFGLVQIKIFNKKLYCFGFM